MTSSKPNRLPWVLSLNCITLGIKASTYTFWGNAIQSIANVYIYFLRVAFPWKITSKIFTILTSIEN